jgi:hypothetical protein
MSEETQEDYCEIYTSEIRLLREVLENSEPAKGYKRKKTKAIEKLNGMLWHIEHNFSEYEMCEFLREFRQQQAQQGVSQ